MTRIDFHSNIPDKIAYACRLVRKARAASADCRIVLRTQTPQELAELDQALWTFSQLDFLPHVTAGDAHADTTPIILADNDETPLPHHGILVNLSAETPAHFASFERMFEIISMDEADKAAGRERYRFYQLRGYPLTHFVADKT
jgi:DNA polymerase-3 subunit chi